MCSKASFVSRDAAIRGMLLILSRESAWARPKHPTRVYACPKCSAWHMTSLGVAEYTPRDAVDARFGLSALYS